MYLLSNALPTLPSPTAATTPIPAPASDIGYTVPTTTIVSRTREKNYGCQARRQVHRACVRECCSYRVEVVGFQHRVLHLRALVSRFQRRQPVSSSLKLELVVDCGMCLPCCASSESRMLTVYRVTKNNIDVSITKHQYTSTQPLESISPLRQIAQIHLQPTNHSPRTYTRRNEPFAYSTNSSFEIREMPFKTSTRVLLFPACSWGRIVFSLCSTVHRQSDDQVKVWPGWRSQFSDKMSVGGRCAS